MTYIILIITIIFNLGLNNHPIILNVKEIEVEASSPSTNIFTSNKFSISKSTYKDEIYYILNSRRNDNSEIYQTLFLNSKAFEKLEKMKKGEELSVCVYYYKDEIEFRDDINLSEQELLDEVTFIENVRSQKYYYEYCGTKMFLKRTNDNSLLLLINNALQTPENWYDNKENLIELKNQSYSDLLELIS